VEVPASTEGTHGGLLPVALPADHTDLGTIGTIWECTGYAKETRGQCPIVASPSRNVRKTYLLFRFKLLVRRFYHLILLWQVDPKLKAARFGLSRFLDGHFSVDNCEITLSMGFDWEPWLDLRHLLPRPCHREMEGRNDYYGSVWRREDGKEGLTAHIHCTPPS
jgi:hypothetical protein